MALLSILFTILLFPVYLALRWPFFRLPLHMDTGYYVSNNTICTGRINFSKGWNAAYAGCSKVLPEFFYSLIYLLHGGADRYKFYSRFYYSLYGYGVAILVGYLAFVLASGDIVAYFIGLTVFCLLSSEPHYGVYFESGEQFELLPQVLGFLLICLGIQSHEAWTVGAGVGLWVLESYFIKLSCFPAAIVLGLGAGYLFPRSFPYSIGFSLLATAAYFGWVAHNGRKLNQLLRPIIGHEVHFDHQVSLRAYVKRLVSKAGFLFLICLSHPIIPALAVVGSLSNGNRIILVLLYLIGASVPLSFALERLTALPSRTKKLLVFACFTLIAVPVIPAFLFGGNLSSDLKTVLLALYFTAVSVSYFIQAAQVWYYTIPFLPVIALLATSGVQALLQVGWPGWATCIGLLLMWVIMNGWRHYTMNIEQLNRWTWLPHRSMPDRNLALDQAAPELRSLIQENSVLVYGHYNQAYALVGTSYPVAIISPNLWLNPMHPGWEEELNQKLANDPPRFILDSDQCFDSEALKDKLGLRYRLLREFPGDFKLFALDGRRTILNHDRTGKPSRTSEAHS